MRLMCLRGQAALGFWSRDQALGFGFQGLRAYWEFSWVAKSRVSK